MLDKWLAPFRHPGPDRVEAAPPATSETGQSRQTATEAGRGRSGHPGGSPGAGGRSAKPLNTVRTLQRIWLYLWQYRGRLAAVIAMIILSTVFSLLGPYMAGMAIDRYISGGSEGFVLFLIAMGVVFALHALTMWLQNIWMITISQKTVLQMRTELFAHLHKLPIPYFGKKKHGELMSRVTNDIENVSASLNSSVIQTISSVLLLVGIVAVMLSISPLLSLIAFLVVPLMAMGMKWITNRTSRLFRAQQRNLGDMNGFVEETLTGQRIVKAFSQEQAVIAEYRKRNERIFLSGFWSQAISGFIPKLMNGLNNLSFALIAGAGAIMAINGSAITVGTIVIFAEYSRQFTRPLNDLANQWNTLLSAIAGAERVFGVMDEEVESRDEAEATELRHVTGKVEFDQVAFAYEEGRPTVQNITFTASPGETVAFVGPTGAGKTTLIQLLCRFYEPIEGEIRIDGKPARSIRRESLRSHMAFVLQDPFLFEGTISDNIRYGKLDATDAEVEAAARLANAHSFIARMKGGYNARLKLDGSGISQGQKQLLAIARAILADPAILVLDEATSSIDTVTEIKIQDALQRLMKGRTSFVIAHRLSTIRQADQIVVLQDGQMIERGGHRDLLRQGGFYSRLVNGQYALEEQA